MPDPDEYDCVACGACCRAEPGLGGDVYVRLDADDVARLRPEEAKALLLPTPSGRRALRLVQNEDGLRRCVALVGRVGRRWVGCSIHERRPQPCRDFAAGSSLCREARREAGLPVGPGRPS